MCVSSVAAVPSRDVQSRLNTKQPVNKLSSPAPVRGQSCIPMMVVQESFAACIYINYRFLPSLADSISYSASAHGLIWRGFPGSNFPKESLCDKSLNRPKIGSQSMKSPNENVPTSKPPHRAYFKQDLQLHKTL